MNDRQRNLVRAVVRWADGFAEDVQPDELSARYRDVLAAQLLCTEDERNEAADQFSAHMAKLS